MVKLIFGVTKFYFLKIQNFSQLFCFWSDLSRHSILSEAEYRVKDKIC